MSATGSWGAAPAGGRTAGNDPGVSGTSPHGHHRASGFGRSGGIRFRPRADRLRKSLHRTNSRRGITKTAGILLGGRRCSSLARGQQREPICRARDHWSLQSQFPHSGDYGSDSVVAERMELEQPEKDHAVSRRALGPRSRLELAQRPGLLVRAAALPDCDHGHDHVLRVGEQSALPHDWECSTASGSGCSSECRRTWAGCGRGRNPEQSSRKPETRLCRDWTSYLLAPACRFRTGRPSACACQITPPGR